MGVAAISVGQPFASAILEGRKTVENRTYQPRAGGLPEGGMWLALHACKELASAETFAAELAALRLVWPELPTDLPRSAVLGFVHVCAVADVADVSDPQASASGLCWRIDAVAPCHVPGVRGQRRVWTWCPPRGLQLPEPVAAGIEWRAVGGAGWPSAALSGAAPAAAAASSGEASAEPAPVAAVAVAAARELHRSSLPFLARRCWTRTKAVRSILSSHCSRPPRPRALVPLRFPLNALPAPEDAC